MNFLAFRLFSFGTQAYPYRQVLFSMFIFNSVREELSSCQFLTSVMRSVTARLCKWHIIYDFMVISIVLLKKLLIDRW